MKNKLKVKSTPYFKLKKDKGKNFIVIDFMRIFGFIPEVIIVDRLPNRNNVVCVRAVLPEEVKEDTKEKDKKTLKELKDHYSGKSSEEKKDG